MGEIENKLVIYNINYLTNLINKNEVRFNNLKHSRIIVGWCQGQLRMELGMIQLRGRTLVQYIQVPAFTHMCASAHIHTHTHPYKKKRDSIPPYKKWPSEMLP